MTLARASTLPAAGVRRPGLMATGVLLAAVALWVPNGAIEAGLGAAPHTLAWGPTLFRALLGWHGLLLVCAGMLGVRPDAGGPVPALAPPSAWVALAGLSAVALGLRLWRLDSDLWFDELLTLLNFVRLPLGAIVTRFPSQNQHMLYSVIAHLSVDIFGESAWALRLPSVLFALGSIWAVFLLGSRVVGWAEALCACALLTVSYHHIWFAQNARGYMGLMFFATLATWLWLNAQVEARAGWSWWLGYVAAVALGMWIHMTMAFVWAAHVIVEGHALGRAGRRVHWRAWAAWLLCATVTLQLYALSLPEFLRSALHEVSLESEWTNPLWVIAESVRSLQIGFSALAVVAGGAGVAIIGVIGIMRRDPAAGLAMMLPPVLGGGSMLALGHNLWPRFFFFSLGFAVLIVVHGAMLAPRLVRDALAPRVSERVAWAAGAALVGVLLVASLLTVPRCYALPKQDFTGARDFVERQRSAGDGVVAVGLAGLAYERYYAPHWSEAQSAAELERLRQLHSTLWLVYTLPVQVQAYRPDVWQMIQRDFEVVRVFPGTLGGGAVYVCRLRGSARARGA